jgi:aspartate carbamoyltransferase catalytic subunit
MHPGPMNRGVEISQDVADSNRAVILEQVTNGLAVRMAVLYLICGAGQQTESIDEEIHSTARENRGAV